MLHAKTELNHSFTTLGKTIEELKKCKQEYGTKFLCPVCNTRVILKIGKKKIPHFSHLPDVACKITKGGESAEHLNGKKILYETIKFHEEQTQLEYYLSEINQVVDVYVHTKDQRYAVEYQCSSIPLEEITHRTNGYRSLKINSIWILGNPPKIHPITSVTRLSSFQLHFTRHHSQLGFYIPFFNPLNDYISFYTNLIPLSSRMFLTSLVHINLSKLTLPFHISKISKPRELTLKSWLNYRERWISNRVGFNHNIRDSFLTTVYSSYDYPIYLPLFIGLPVKGMIQIQTHPIEWQYYVWFDNLKKLKKGEKIAFSTLLKSFQLRVKQGSIMIRSLPFVEHQDLKWVLRNYLKLLMKIGIVESTGNQSYILLKEWEQINNHTKFMHHSSDFFYRNRHILNNA